MYASCKRSHLLIAAPLNVPVSERPLAPRNITKTNNMTSDMTPSEVVMGPELN
jgi:hypothetical protein